MTVKLLTEHHLEFLNLKGGCTNSSESAFFKMPHCLKSNIAAHIYIFVVFFFFFWGGGGGSNEPPGSPTVGHILFGSYFLPCSVGHCVIPCAFFGKIVKHIFSCSKMYLD